MPRGRNETSPIYLFIRSDDEYDLFRSGRPLSFVAWVRMMDARMRYTYDTIQQDEMFGDEGEEKIRLRCYHCRTNVVLCFLFLFMFFFSSLAKNSAAPRHPCYFYLPISCF